MTQKEPDLRERRAIEDMLHAKVPAQPDYLHRALNVEPDRSADVTRSLVGKYEDTYAFFDGRFEVCWKGRSLPHKIFDLDQRVTHAAITENKRLSAVLEHIKEPQDAAPPKPKVRTNSEKMGYQPRVQQKPEIQVRGGT